MLLSSVKQLESISIAVSVTVIVLLVLSFGALFYLYYRYYAKCIDNKIEDNYIKREVILENKKYFSRVEGVLADAKLDAKSKRDSLPKFEKHLEEKKRSHKNLKVVANTFLVIFYVAFLSIMSFAIYVRSSGDLFMVNGVSCLVIRTGSMEEAHENNKYIVEHGLDNQISAYSLIGIEKVKEEEIALYDIVAFYNKKEQIVVHRVINVYEKEGVVHYNTKGDANTASASYEIGLTYDDIVGKYNGFQNFGLGVTIYYLQSNIGIITVSLSLLLIGFYDLLEVFLGKRIQNRKLSMSTTIDDEIDYLIASGKKPHYLDYAKKKVTTIFEDDR